MIDSDSWGKIYITPKSIYLDQGPKVNAVCQRHMILKKRYLVKI